VCVLRCVQTGSDLCVCVCVCVCRYYDCLKAETKRGVFDQQEKQLLLLLVQKHGVGEIPSSNREAHG